MTREFTHPPDHIENLKFCHVKEKELGIFYNLTGISLVPHHDYSQKSQTLKRAFEITTTDKMLKSLKKPSVSKNRIFEASHEPLIAVSYTHLDVYKRQV